MIAGRNRIVTERIWRDVLTPFERDVVVQLLQQAGIRLPGEVMPHVATREVTSAGFAVTFERTLRPNKRRSKGRRTATRFGRRTPRS